MKACHLLLILALLLPNWAAADPRRLYEADSPPWLLAVGKLEVPGIRYIDGRRRHHREDCSATLVSDRPGRPADTIVTAWHCLEAYRDLSLAITFTLLPGSGQAFRSEAVRLEDGGDITADWAILRLLTPVPPGRAPALAVAPRRGDPGRRLVMAGYSRDTGNAGQRLSYDPACRILRQQAATSESDCRAARGASGGAVIQLSATGEPQLTGVISQGDSEGFSIFIPISRFRRPLARHLH